MFDAIVRLGIPARPIGFGVVQSSERPVIALRSSTQVHGPALTYDLVKGPGVFDALVRLEVLARPIEFGWVHNSDRVRMPKTVQDQCPTVYVAGIARVGQTRKRKKGRVRVQVSVRQPLAGHTAVGGEVGHTCVQQEERSEDRSPFWV